MVSIQRRVERATVTLPDSERPDLPQTRGATREARVFLKRTRLLQRRAVAEIDLLVLGPPSFLTSDRTGRDPRSGGANVAPALARPKVSIAAVGLSTVHGQSALAGASRTQSTSTQPAVPSSIDMNDSCSRAIVWT